MTMNMSTVWRVGLLGLVLGVLLPASRAAAHPLPVALAGQDGCASCPETNDLSPCWTEPCYLVRQIRAWQDPSCPCTCYTEYWTWYYRWVPPPPHPDPGQSAGPLLDGPPGDCDTYCGYRWIVTCILRASPEGGQ